MAETTPNEAYWARRFDELHNSLIDDGGACYDTAERLFYAANRDIEADIARWYERLAANNAVSLAEARRMLSKDELKEFHWTVDEYIKRGQNNAVSGQWLKELENASAKFHISRLESIRIQMQQHLEELYGNYIDALDKTMRDIYSEGYYRTAYTLQQGFHTGFDVSKLDEKAIDMVIQKPWASDGRNFSDRIWTDKTKLLNELQSALLQGLVRGDGIAELTRRMADRMNVSRSNARRLIQTESAYFAAMGEMDSMKELGVKKYKYLATLDSRTSETCREMDGKIFDVTDYKPGTTAPPLHVYCRSTTIPYYGRDGKLRAARDEGGKTVYIPNMSYRDWKAVFVDGTKRVDSISWMHNFKPEYGKTDTVGLPGIEEGVQIKKVTNSQFDLWTDASETDKDMAVRLCEKYMRDIAPILPKELTIPKIIVLNFEKYGFGADAIAGYDGVAEIMYINRKYRTPNSIRKYLNKNKGWFASTDEKAPYLHELGHRYHQVVAKKFANARNISVHDAYNELDALILKVIHEESKVEYDAIADQISRYAHTSYKKQNTLREFMAETFVLWYSKEKSDLADKIRDLFRAIT